MREWLRGEGHEVSNRGAVPKAKAELYYERFPDRRPAGAVRLLPGPEDDLDAYEDLGDMTVPGADEYLGAANGPPDGTAVPSPPPGPPAADPEPAHAKRDWRKQGKGKTAAKPARVTVGVRTDIEAKISFALEIPGRVWQARDPACGGMFVQQRPEIAGALTEIVCQSADLVAWFSGSGGQFMLWLNLAAACWPVATIVMAHHVYHTLEPGTGDPLAPDYSQFAA